MIKLILTKVLIMYKKLGHLHVNSFLQQSNIVEKTTFHYRYLKGNGQGLQDMAVAIFDVEQMILPILMKFFKF